MREREREREMAMAIEEYPINLPLQFRAKNGVIVDPVESLVKKGVQKIPQKWVRPGYDVEFSSSSTTNPSNDNSINTTKSIPIIDMAPLWDEENSYEKGDDGEESRRLHARCVAEMREALGRACEEWGFFQIINHGVPESLMDDMMREAQAFFALPIEDKLVYTTDPGLIKQGYGSKYIAEEGAVRDWRDYLYLHLDPPSTRDYDHWPVDASFRETVDKYSKETLKVGKKLLSLLSENLGLHPFCFEEHLVKIHQKMLINYYPPCPEPELTAGFHKHSDFGAITLVMQEVGVVGLQVHKDGEWVPIVPEKGAYVVNIADQVEILSNGRYKSIEHRVVTNPYKSRISVPVFHDAALDAVICPIKDILKNENDCQYNKCRFEDHEITFYSYGANGKTPVQSYIVPSKKENH